MRKDDAISYFGSASELARAIGVTPGLVCQWKTEVPKSRRQSVRLAMRERANELEKQAARLRLESWSDE